MTSRDIAFPPKATANRTIKADDNAANRLKTSNLIADCSDLGIEIADSNRRQAIGVRHETMVAKVPRVPKSMVV